MKQDLLFVGWSTLFAIVMGSLIGIIVGWTLNVPLLLGALQGILAGAIIGSFTSFLSRMYPNLKQGAWLRELPFSASIALKSFANFIIIIFAIRFGVFVVFPDGNDPFQWGSPQVLFSMIVSAYFIVSINFVTGVNRMLGQRVLRNFTTGAYHHPHEENRIFLFIDVNGSTGIAERIGAIRYHAFLDQFFSDLSDAILQYRGEIHKYVGDEVIITWPFASGTQGQPVACHFAIKSRIEARRRFYEANFGFFPEFTAALHAGSVVTGEMGDIKREIVFLGDTVNTSARMIDMCTDLNESFVTSSDALDIMELPEAIEKREIGPTEFRGRREPVTLFGLYFQTQ